MRQLLILCTVLFSIQSFSQKTKTDYDYYENGQVHWKGELVLKENGYNPIGLWQYWHENGKLKLETWDYDNSKTKYINMWLSTGEQILKNGFGEMYEVWPGGDQEADSTIYGITDSIKQGSAKIYRLYKGGSYFFVMAGQYDQNSKETGLWTYRDTVHGNAFECYYLQGNKNGSYRRFYLNGTLRDSGQYRNDNEEDEWKYFDSSGIVIKECNFKDGNLIGNYREFFTNGKLKISGTYRQGEGLIKVSSRSMNTRKIRVYYRKIYNKEFKTGKWIYFDSKGNILKTEKIK